MTEKTDKEIIARLRQQVLELEDKLSELKRQIRIKDEALHEKNLALDAYHHVWCSGSCLSGIHRYHDAPLTEEIVKEAELNTKQLRVKFNELMFQAAWAQVPDEEKAKIRHECLVAKTRDWHDATREAIDRYKDTSTRNVLDQKRQLQ